MAECYLWAFHAENCSCGCSNVRSNGLKDEAHFRPLGTLIYSHIQSFITNLAAQKRLNNYVGQDTIFI